MNRRRRWQKVRVVQALIPTSVTLSVRRDPKRPRDGTTVLYTERFDGLVHDNASRRMVRMAIENTIPAVRAALSKTGLGERFVGAESDGLGVTVALRGSQHQISWVIIGEFVSWTSQKTLDGVIRTVAKAVGAKVPHGVRFKQTKKLRRRP